MIRHRPLTQPPSWSWSIGLILILIATARIAMALGNPGSYVDEYLHITAALGMDDAPYMRGLYVTHIVRLALDFFGYSLPALKLIPAILGIINTLLVWRISRHLFRSNPYVLLTLFLYAASPWVIFNHFYIRTYVFLELTVLLLLWFGVSLIRHRPTEKSVAATALLAIPITTIYFFFTHDSSKIIPVFLLALIFSFFLGKSLYSQPNCTGKAIRALTSTLRCPRQRTWLLLAFFGAIIASLASNQNYLTNHLSSMTGFEMIHTDAAHKFQEYFLTLNIIFTILLAIGLFKALERPWTAPALVLIASSSLLFFHSIAGYQFQMLRAIFYFQGPFTMAAVYGLSRLDGSLPPKAIIAVALVATVYTNYPRPMAEWLKKPDIPKEITYRDYSRAFDAARASGQPLFGLTVLAEGISRFHKAPFPRKGIDVTVWQPPERVKPYLDDFLSAYPDAVLLLDGEGFSRFRDHGFDQILARKVRPRHFSGYIFLYDPSQSPTVPP